ncbi:MAG TPA: T9SS type A sorting domain-containing protein [Flavobacterium sp.]|jgi:hypothetical protein
MKSFSTFVALFSAVSCFAQLNITPGSYLFVRDQMVFVKQDINLRNNGNIFLRQDAQLLQGTTGSSTNRGPGELSVFQEGTVDNFEYNYWCSPIGNSSNTSGNENFGITMLERPVTLTTSAPAVILGAGLSNGEAFPLKIASLWINKFLSSANYSQWIPVLNASTIAPGEGFTMKGTSGTDVTMIYGVPNNSGGAQRYDFRGKPNDGTITVNVANNQFTLTGNPYPSAIDLSAFLTEALNCTGVAYFWEQDKTINSHLIASYRGGYGTFSPVSRGGTGIYVPAPFYAFASDGTQLGVQSTPMNSYARYFAPIGQGFLVEGNGSGPTVTMKNSYRVFQKENAATSVFERSADAQELVNSDYLPEIASVSGFDYTTVSTAPVPQIQFNALLNNTGFRQFVLAFDDAATDAADHAMDARTPSAGLPADVFFAIDESEYVISVIDFDSNKRIPLGLKSTTEANFKIAVSNIVNFAAADNVYIYDKETQIYHDIKNGIFEITLAAGTTTSRFEVTFTNELLETPEAVNHSLSILQNNDTQFLTVYNPDAADIQSVALFDMAGKRVFSKEKIGTSTSTDFSTSGLAEGVYIAKITANNGAVARKISIFRAR